MTQVVGCSRSIASAAGALHAAPEPAETCSIVVKSPNNKGQWPRTSCHRMYIIVPYCISADKIMPLSHENHLGDQISYEQFKKAKIVRRSIRSGPEVASNAVIEGTPAMKDRLTSAGKVYVKWFSYRVRSHDLLPA